MQKKQLDHKINMFYEIKSQHIKNAIHYHG